MNGIHMCEKKKHISFKVKYCSTVSQLFVSQKLNDIQFGWAQICSFSTNLIIYREFAYFDKGSKLASPPTLEVPLLLPNWHHDRS